MRRSLKARWNVKKSTPAISVAATLPMRPRAYNAQANSKRISSGVSRSLAGTSGSSIVMLFFYSSQIRESNLVLILHRQYIKIFLCNSHHNDPATRDQNTSKREGISELEAGEFVALDVGD